MGQERTGRQWGGEGLGRRAEHPHPPGCQQLINTKQVSTDPRPQSKAMSFDTYRSLHTTTNTTARLTVNTKTGVLSPSSLPPAHGRGSSRAEYWLAVHGGDSPFYSILIPGLPVTVNHLRTQETTKQQRCGLVKQRVNSQSSHQEQSPSVNWCYAV